MGMAGQIDDPPDNRDNQDASSASSIGGPFIVYVEFSERLNRSSRCPVDGESANGPALAVLPSS